MDIDKLVRGLLPTGTAQWGWQIDAIDAKKESITIKMRYRKAGARWETETITTYL